MYENFVGTWETVRNREVSVLERCPHGEVRLANKLITDNFIGGTCTNFNTVQSLVQENLKLTC